MISIRRFRLATLRAAAAARFANRAWTEEERRTEAAAAAHQQQNSQNDGNQNADDHRKAEREIK